MTFRKWKLFTNYQTEEKWLNQMATDGYMFKHYRFGRYTFVSGEPNEYEYRLELLENHPKTQGGKDYIAFMVDTGVECVDTFMGWAYFRRKTTDGPFEIYTDKPSQTNHINRVTGLMLFASLICLFVSLINISLGVFETGLINLIVGGFTGVLFLVTFSIYLIYKKKFSIHQQTPNLEK